jgi:threonyl-tRNA synthetase
MADHRKIGIENELFFFDETSPGSAFWLPNGTRIFTKLQELIRKEYYLRGFSEVMTPVIAKKDLWEISGHWDKYKENMFCFECDNTDYGIASMNCPKHCIMYKYRVRSYRELPIRFADFGALHRNELSGALTGLTRVRMFHQDDAHIFCTKAQIKSEMKNALEFITYIYGIFGFQIDMGLSTRPESYVGKIEEWDNAEQILTDILTESGIPWIVKEKDGSFYGPKIDIHLTDSNGKKHQCATIQLDFQLPGPDRFDLKYLDENDKMVNPVMIHRAIYGSFERFIAILCEHYVGKFPLWISPKQLVVIPISEKNLEYANTIYQALRQHGFYADIDTSDNVVNKKIAGAHAQKYNYILIVGHKESNNKTVNVRYRDDISQNTMTLDDLIIEVKQNIAAYK